MIQPTKNTPEKSKIGLVSTQKTKTVSQKSVLTYHIGKDEEANQYIRIWVNSGNGYFSNEWIPVSRILEILAKHKAEPFTSRILDELFTGKSVNSASFLGAVLLNEKFHVLIWQQISPKTSSISTMACTIMKSGIERWGDW